MCDHSNSKAARVAVFVLLSCFGSVLCNPLIFMYPGPGAFGGGQVKWSREEQIVLNSVNNVIRSIHELADKYGHGHGQGNGVSANDVWTTRTTAVAGKYETRPVPNPLVATAGPVPAIPYVASTSRPNIDFKLLFTGLRRMYIQIYFFLVFRR